MPGTCCRRAEPAIGADCGEAVERVRSTPSRITRRKGVGVRRPRHELPAVLFGDDVEPSCFRSGAETVVIRAQHRARRQSRLQQQDHLGFAVTRPPVPRSGAHDRAELLGFAESADDGASTGRRSCGCAGNGRAARGTAWLPLMLSRAGRARDRRGLNSAERYGQTIAAPCPLPRSHRAIASTHSSPPPSMTMSLKKQMFIPSTLRASRTHAGWPRAPSSQDKSNGSP